MAVVHSSEVSTNSTTANKSKDIFQRLQENDFGELHFRHDPKTGLNAIIAIHNTKLGPALGGCRFKEYSSTEDALHDVTRLSQAMSYKAAISGLALGGGKSVILKPKQLIDRKAFFESFGNFVNDLGGRYITAMDSGTTEQDMNDIAAKTNHVASQSQPDGSSGDPSSYTARGVALGIEAAVEYKLKKKNLKDIHVVIQGVGNVGYFLARELHQRGAKLTVCDINESYVERCVKEFGANVVPVDFCFSVQCDVFAPCALGGVINSKTLLQLNTPIIAGAANNQLAIPAHGIELQLKGILYAPDYVINAGGLIQAGSLYYKESEAITLSRIDKIHSRLIEIFSRADKENRSCNDIADVIAKELIK